MENYESLALLNQRAYLIFHSYSECGKFVFMSPLTQEQYHRLSQIALKCGKFPHEFYQRLLKKFQVESGLPFLRLLRLAPDTKFPSGSIISISKDQPSEGDPVQDQPGVHRVELPHNRRDFDLPGEGIAIFRCFQWPFKKVLNHDSFQLLSNTFGGKGLVRHCTDHSGSFEFIGVRRSSQSSGSMCCAASKTSNHQYYRKSINTALFPLMKGVLNALQKEAIDTLFTSGEVFMDMYQSYFKVTDRKKGLASQSLVTQRHFTNTCHIDKANFLRCDESENVIETMKQFTNWKGYLERYNTIFEGKPLPKPTVCCWTLREDDPNFVMYQFFCFPTALFCFDVSSTVTNEFDNVGAIFMSGLSVHCTSIPIFIDTEGFVHLKGPKNMYNLAWGADEGNGRSLRRNYYDRNGGPHMNRLTENAFIHWIQNTRPDLIQEATQLGLM
jgi:hypothetical protein